MRRVIVIKTGATMPALKETRGDYEDWIASGMGTAVRTVNVLEGEVLPDANEVDAAVITGSSAMVTERLPWSVQTASWLADYIDRGGAVLGICYGHQLLADALGGEVGYNPRGREIGTVEVRVRDRDPLLSIDDTLVMQASHQQTVLKPPSNARVLATSARDECQAFAIGDRVWGVQFHPEWDHDVVLAYLDARREILRGEGIDADELITKVRASDHGRALLARFAEIVL